MSRISNKKQRKIIPLTLIAAGVILVGLHFYNTIHNSVMLDAGDDFYSELAEQVSTLPPGTPIPVQTPESQGTPEPTGTGNAPEPSEAQTGPEEVSEHENSMSRFDFGALQDEFYKDMVAWIRCPGTKIDYPVMQGTDNDFYLDHLPDGTQNIAGAIFIDFRNSASLSDKHTVIYGHHIKNGAMFGSLDNYKSQSHYDAHPSIELYTPNGDYTALLFAGYVVDADIETIPLSFKSAEEFTQYIEEVRARSTFSSDIEVNAGDRLVSFCTCTYDFDNARYILVGKLMSN